ncbi:unnamed protein product [Knipowitschia caucasica]
MDKLIGEVPTVDVKLHNAPIKCILDTGSNVSMITEGFYQRYLDNGTVLKDASTWLALEAANGLNIPYVGYALLPVKIGELELPECGFLVTKDYCLTNSEGILGMNIISRCFEVEKPIACFSKDKAQQVSWRSALRICAKKAQFSAPDGSIGHVRTISRHPIMVPAQSDVLVWGRTKPGVNDQDYQCLVEPLEVGDLFVARSLSTVKNGRVLLRVRNVNDSPIYLYRHQKLARTFAIDSAEIMQENDVNMTRVGVNSVRVSTGPITPQSEPCVLPDLTNSDLPAEQTWRLKDLLYKHRAVFAQHDEDYGLTSAMQHEIPTGIATQ